MTLRTPKALRAKFSKTLICYSSGSGRTLGVRTRPRVAVDCWTYVFTHEKARLRFTPAWQPIDSNGRTIWIADAHRGDGKRFVVRADEKPTAFMEPQSAIRPNQPGKIKGD